MRYPFIQAELEDDLGYFGEYHRAFSSQCPSRTCQEARHPTIGDSCHWLKQSLLGLSLSMAGSPRRGPHVQTLPPQCGLVYQRLWQDLSSMEPLGTWAQKGCREKGGNERWDVPKANWPILPVCPGPCQDLDGQLGIFLPSTTSPGSSRAGKLDRSER